MGGVGSIWKISLSHLLLRPSKHPPPHAGRWSLSVLPDIAPGGEGSARDMGVCVCGGGGREAFCLLSLQKHIPEDILKATLQTWYPLFLRLLPCGRPGLQRFSRGRKGWCGNQHFTLTPGTYKNSQI